MHTVNEMTVEELTDHISKIPTNSACSRASILRLQTLLEQKVLEQQVQQAPIISP
jgi:hypothetical protein